MWKQLKKISVVDFLIAVAILMILAGVVVPGFQNARRQALAAHPPSANTLHRSSR